MPTTEDIPDEVLELLFSKLPLSDRKSVRLVSRRWLAVCNGVSVTKHECLKLQFKDLNQVKIPRGCLNLIINKCDVLIQDAILQQKEFWVEHGSTVRSLKITEWSEYCKIVDYIFDHCPNITELSLLCFDDIVWFDSDEEFGYDDDDDGSSFDNDSFDSDTSWEDLSCSSESVAIDGDCPRFDFLTSLTISCGNVSSFMTRSEFAKLTASVPNLNRLELVEVNIRKESYKKAICKLIEKQSLTITELVFTKCKIATSVFLAQVLNLIGPQLVSLHLVDLPLTHVDCLIKFPNLKNLEFKNIHISDFSVLPRMEDFKSLEFISFQCSDIYEGDLFLFGDLEKLKGFDVRNTECSTREILNRFGHKVHPNLLALQMSRAPDNVFAAILPNLTNLMFLDLSCSNGIMTNVGLKAIITNCKQLTHLDLKDCCKIKDLTRPVSINGLTNLVYLNLNNCNRVNARSVAELRFDKLRSLGLVVLSLSVEGLKEVVKNCPRLKNVNVNARLPGLSDVLINAGIRNVPLRSLTIFDFRKN